MREGEESPYPSHAALIVTIAGRGQASNSSAIASFPGTDSRKSRRSSTTSAPPSTASFISPFIPSTVAAVTLVVMSVALDVTAPSLEPDGTYVFAGAALILLMILWCGSRAHLKDLTGLKAVAGKARTLGTPEAHSRQVAPEEINEGSGGSSGCRGDGRDTQG